MSSITSAELNYLIFRYLNESGFTHTAFTLGYEAGINESNIDGNLIPPGALVTFIQKGIQYLELEANLSNDGDETDEDFLFLHPLELITKDVSELRKIVKEKKEKIQKDKSKEKGKKIIENGEEHNHKNPKEKDKVLARVTENEKQHKDKEKERDRYRIDKEKEKAKGKEKEKSFEDVSDINHMQNQIIARIEENGANGGPEPMDVCPISVISPCEILNSDVTILRGHTSEVVACTWNPTSSHLASSSGDSTARIWTIDGPPNSNLENGASSVVLRHFQGGTEEKQHKDATTVDWNAEGKLLAVGSYDGQARIWSREGQLISTLSKHKGPIFALKWNKKGDFLLSGSVDKTAVVWDVNSGSCWQQFGFHSAVVLDVDWRNNTSFATCSIDSMIYVCKVGDNRPIRSFSHEGEVNAVKWDPTGSLLASCSDDTTAKIWSMKQDKCLLDLRGHNREIYTVKWSPTGQGTMNPNKQLMLASASFDSTVKLWDVDTGRLVHSLNGHRDHVYSISFSPNGEYLASGSLDGNVHIWSVKEAKIVRTFSGKSGIFEVCWNREGNKIAACFSDSVVCVVNLRM